MRAHICQVYNVILLLKLILAHLLTHLPSSTDILWSRMAIGRSPGRSKTTPPPPPVLTSCGQEWQLADLPADLPPGADI